MTNEMKADKVINGTHGRIWFNGQELGNVKSFEAKAKYQYADIKIAGKMSKSRKLMGYEVSGTMVLNKIDSTIARLIGDDIKKGIQPELKIVGALSDPAAYGAERVEITVVTIDELQILKFEGGKEGEEEVPFEAEDYNFIDMI